LKIGGDFGGETSGAWIFPRFSFCPDGIYAAARIAAIAAQNKLSALADAITLYPIMRTSISSVGVSLPTVEAKLLNLKPRNYTKIDGLKVDFKSGWMLIRPSGTEPKIRVTVEAKTDKAAQEYFDLAMKAIEHSTNIGEKKR
jgi:phosphoglucosamine mutase